MRNLTREQAVHAVGTEVVDKLDGLNCEPTNRLQKDGDDSVEYSASLDIGEEYGRMTLTAYYYQSCSDLARFEDLSNLEWVVAHYELT